MQSVKVVSNGDFEFEGYKSVSASKPPNSAVRVEIPVKVQQKTMKNRSNTA